MCGPATCPIAAPTGTATGAAGPVAAPSAPLIGHLNFSFLAILSYAVGPVDFEQMTNSPPEPQPKAGRRPPDLSMNQEPDGFETLDRIVAYEADYVALLPAGLYVWGLVEGGTESLIFAVWLWLLVVLFWVPWITLRVAMRTPPSDPLTALATVGAGLWPWLIFLFAMEWASTRTGLTVTFPLIFGFGASTLMAAHFGWPRTTTSGGRSRLLLTGASVFGLYAVLFLGALALGVAEVAGILTAPIVILGLGAAVASLVLLQAATRPATSPGP
jgi:hypothetical protein